MDRSKIQAEIDRLEAFNKKGESYANANGSFGWRNPIRRDTGRLLQSLIVAANPARVLEIGTAHGLSALYLVSGLMDAAATIDTIEFDKEVAADTQQRLEALAVPVKVIADEAMAAIDRLEGHYDVVFFDAQKSHYHPQLLRLLEKKLIGRGSLLLADNVIDRQDECREFLEWFVTNRTHHTIVDTECGLLVARL